MRRVLFPSTSPLYLLPLRPRPLRNSPLHCLHSYRGSCLQPSADSCWDSYWGDSYWDSCMGSMLQSMTDSYWDSNLQPAADRCLVSYRGDSCP